MEGGEGMGRGVRGPRRSENNNNNNKTALSAVRGWAEVLARGLELLDGGPPAQVARGHNV